MAQRINLMIIGAPKSATTSLLRYLEQHPSICTHSEIEINAFINSEEYAEGDGRIISRYFKCNKLNQVLVGKSAGLMYNNEALQRLRKHNPTLQLVVLLRNPIDRAYSAYLWARRRGWEEIDNFTDAIKVSPSRYADDWLREGSCQYLEYGRYATYLGKVEELFPHANIHVWTLEQLRNDPLHILQTLTCALDLSDFPYDVTSKRENRAAEPRSLKVASFISGNSFFKRGLKMLFPWRLRQSLRRVVWKINDRPCTPTPIDPNLRRELQEFYSDENEKLASRYKIQITWN